MTTSNSTDFNQTRDQIISDALIGLGVYRPGATISTVDYNYCSNILNKLVKAWQGQGIHMWKATEGTLFLVNGQNKYTLSSTSTDLAGDNVVETTLTADGSGTSLTVTSTSGMITGDTIVICLDDNTLQSTTITVNSSTSLTLGTTLTSACSSGARVATYTTHATRPTHISSARFNNSDGTDRMIYLRGRDEFMLIPNKEITGKVNQAFYSPNISDGTLYVWPTPDSVTERIKYSYIKMIQDFDASADNPDFPTEWLDCLTLNLMYRVAKPYGRDADDRQQLKADADESLLNMQLWDGGQGSTRICQTYRDE